jgi:cyclopropane fatty-acyl-phospholipid synthase-like methyltransferase
MTDRPFAEAAQRNSTAILEVLRREFRETTDVLEIGSGTGQHAVTFAAAIPGLRWQTSDLDEHHASINAWIDTADIETVFRPVTLDVRIGHVEPASYDAVFSANTAHIMGIDAVRRMFAVVGDALRADGVFCLYGPFRIGGRFNTESNERFDASLRQRDGAMGIRDLEALDEFGAPRGLQRQRLYAMPSNNLIAVWTRPRPSRQGAQCRR